MPAPLESIPYFVSMTLPMVISRIGKMETSSRSDDGGNGSVTKVIPEAKEDFFKAIDPTRFSSGGPLEGFFRLGFFSALFVGASFAISPVSPIAAVDVGETMASRVCCFC